MNYFCDAAVRKLLEQTELFCKLSAARRAEPTLGNIGQFFAPTPAATPGEPAIGGLPGFALSMALPGPAGSLLWAVDAFPQIPAAIGAALPMQANFAREDWLRGAGIR